MKVLILTQEARVKFQVSELLSFIFLAEPPKQKVPLLLEIARFMKTNPIKGAAWHHRKFRFNQTKPKLAWLGWVVRSISGSSVFKAKKSVGQLTSWRTGHLPSYNGKQNKACIFIGCKGTLR